MKNLMLFPPLWLRDLNLVKVCHFACRNMNCPIPPVHCMMGLLAWCRRMSLLSWAVGSPGSGNTRFQSSISSLKQNTNGKFLVENLSCRFTTVAVVSPTFPELTHIHYVRGLAYSFLPPTLNHTTNHIWSYKYKIYMGPHIHNMGTPRW